jgi:hypothetical protein
VANHRDKVAIGILFQLGFYRNWPNCSGFFDGRFDANYYARIAQLSFTDIAADAFEADVTDKVWKRLIDDQGSG